MQYMRALFVSEEPEKDAPEKMAGLLSDYKIQSERRKKGPRILGLTGSDVTKVCNLYHAQPITIMSPSPEQSPRGAALLESLGIRGISLHDWKAVLRRLVRDEHC